MRITEGQLRRIIREELLREGIGSASPAEVEAGIRDYVRKNIPPSADVRDAIRQHIMNPQDRRLPSYIASPIDDGGDPYAYRGIKVKLDGLPAFGLDPEELPTEEWFDLTEDGLPPRAEWIELPTVEGKTISSWSYDPNVAKRFASTPAPGYASIVLAAHIYKNFPRFLDLFPVYGPLRVERQSGELEIMGVASDEDPIKGFVKLVRLP
jgi:hypothetical protein